MIEIKIAFRNLLRNKRRTILTFLIIAFSFSSLVVYASYVEYVRVDFRESIIKDGLGHLHVTKKGYYDNKDLKYSLDSIMPKEELEKIGSIIEQVNKKVSKENRVNNVVKSYSPRLLLQGIISTSDKSTVFQGMGIDPIREGTYMNTAGATATKSINLTFAGSTNNHYSKLFSKKVDVPLADGTTPTFSSSISIGKDLADYLKVGVNDDVTLLINVDGSQEAWNAKIAGISDFGVPEYNEIRVVSDIDTAKQLYYINGAHDITILLEKTKYLKRFKELLDERLKGSSLGLEVRDWLSLDNYYKKGIRVYETQKVVVTIILLIVILISVSNVIFMSVMERVPEFGTVRAVGISKGEVFLTIFWEGVIISILSLLIATIFTYIEIEVVNQIKIIMPPAPGRTQNSLFRGLQSFNVYLQNIIAMAVIIIISSILPAFGALKIEIAKAIRCN